MAREIVIWCECDLEEDDARVPASEHEVTLDGKTFTVDLCPVHDELHLAPLRALLEKYGQPVGPQKRPYKKSGKYAGKKSGKVEPSANGMYVCDHPGCGLEFSRSQGLGRHKLSHA